MNTTPAQRAEWAKLDKEATPGEWCADVVSRAPHHYSVWTKKEECITRSFKEAAANAKLIAAYRSAVPSLIADVEELLEKFAGEEKVSDELAEMAGKYQRDWETAQAQVERLTALLRDLRNLLDGFSVDGFWTDPKTSEPYWVCHLKMAPGEFGKLSISGKRIQVQEVLLRCRIEKELR